LAYCISVGESFLYSHYAQVPSGVVFSPYRVVRCIHLLGYTLHPLGLYIVFTLWVCTLHPLGLYVPFTFWGCTLHPLGLYVVFTFWGCTLLTFWGCTLHPPGLYVVFAGILWGLN